MPKKKVYSPEQVTSRTYDTLNKAWGECKDAMKISEEDDPTLSRTRKTSYHFNDSTIILIEQRGDGPLIPNPGPTSHFSRKFIESTIYTSEVNIYARDLAQIKEAKSKLEKLAGVELK